MSVAERLARLVEEVSGNVVPPRDVDRLARAARARAESLGCSDLDAYVERLAQHRRGEEWRHLLAFVTVNESYLFRAPQQFAAIEGTILPPLVGARAAARRLRVWSAGCARGEEAATLAILLAEQPSLVGWDWRVVATDVDDEALDDARQGVFGARAVARVPPPLLDRYFGRTGSSWQLSRALLERIDFRHLNLVHIPFEDLPAPFDLILLRNVLIYFREESQRRVVHAVARALAPDGALFLGPSETLWQLTDELAPVELKDCFCYRPREAVPPEPRRAREPSGPRRALPASPAPPARRPEPPPAPRVEVEPAAEAGYGPILESIAASRLGEAAALLERRLERAPEDPVLHALKGIVRDTAGDAEGATVAYRAALYLDPQLFQVRLLLGRLLRRGGWPERARREHRSALATLEAATGRELPGSDLLALPNARQAAARARDALE